MNLVLASDFAGFALKEEVKAHLLAAGYPVTDVGEQEPGGGVVYVDAVANLAAVLQAGSCQRGILICGTGGGVSILANKYKGIYCVACESLFTAPKCAAINNANVLAMGGRVVGPANACEMVDAWLAQSFCQDMEPQRASFIRGLFNRLQEIENENFK